MHNVVVEHFEILPCFLEALDPDNPAPTCLHSPIEVNCAVLERSLCVFASDSAAWAGWDPADGRPGLLSAARNTHAHRYLSLRGYFTLLCQGQMDVVKSLSNKNDEFCLQISFFGSHDLNTNVTWPDLIQITIMAPPYGNCDDTMRSYERSECLLKCQTDAVTSRCGCSDVYMSNDTAPTCDVRDLFQCARPCNRMRSGLKNLISYTKSRQHSVVLQLVSIAGSHP